MINVVVVADNCNENSILEIETHVAFVNIQFSSETSMHKSIKPEKNSVRLVDSFEVCL